MPNIDNYAHVIDDSNWEQHADLAFLNDQTNVGQHGLVKRDFDAFPVGGYGTSVPFDIAGIEMLDWKVIWEMIADQTAHKGTLHDMRMVGNNGEHIPALNQGPHGICWSFSTCMAIMMNRCRNNEPYVKLSGASEAWWIKHADQGGWGADSFDKATHNGYATDADWPELYLGPKYDTPEVRERAKAFCITEGFVDLTAPIYNRDMSRQQQASLAAQLIPVVKDLNWRGHSECFIGLVDCDSRLAPDDPNRAGWVELNSWQDSYGTLGEGVIRGNRGVGDAAVAPRVVTGA